MFVIPRKADCEMATFAPSLRGMPELLLDVKAVIESGIPSAHLSALRLLRSFGAVKASDAPRSCSVRDLLRAPADVLRAPADVLLRGIDPWKLEFFSVTKLVK